MSADDDFVLTAELRRYEILEIIAPLGFRENGRIYVHPDVVWTIDFPRGPVAIGRDIITTWATERRGDEILYVISPTDSVRDRFMHYFAWNDYSGLTQAVAVAKAQRTRVNLDAFRAWAEIELQETPAYDRRRVDAFFTALEAA